MVGERSRLQDGKVHLDAPERGADRLHERDFDGVVINAGGLTHTSVALRDALLGVAKPFVEVHLSDPSTREPFRSVNFLHDVAVTSVVGKGPVGYVLGLNAIVEHLRASG